MNINDSFKPDFIPIEMVKQGVFKGAYFNEPRINKKTGLQWYYFVPVEFTNEVYLGKPVNLTCEPNINHNKYKIDCGSSFEFWTKKNWIEDIDPYGWFNWYINYYYGRRCYDDERQIKRWLNFKVRHGGTLKRFPDSLKTKQNLLHWAIDWRKLV